MEPYHLYHAEAHVLSGFLKHPVDQPIEHHALAVLKDRKKDDHITQTVEETSVEGVVSFKSGHSRVSGSKIQKRDLWGKDHSGWITLSTSVIEGLNVFEVITADRVVSQVASEHRMMKDPKTGKDVPSHVPIVTFLGTRFENLRVAGYPVDVELDFNFCGEKPDRDRSYLDERSFLDRVHRQADGIARAKGAPDELAKGYRNKATSIDEIRKGNWYPKGDGNDYPKVECSLVKRIGEIPLPGVKVYGNVIFIPDFGTVSLAEVEVGDKPEPGALVAVKGGKNKSNGNASHYFTITMLNMRLGCIGGGNIKVGGGTVNGHTKP
jgi:hypothetical protein